MSVKTEISLFRMWATTTSFQRSTSCLHAIHLGCLSSPHPCLNAAGAGSLTQPKHYLGKTTEYVLQVLHASDTPIIREAHVRHAAWSLLGKTNVTTKQASKQLSSPSSKACRRKRAYIASMLFRVLKTTLHSHKTMFLFCCVVP